MKDEKTITAEDNVVFCTPPRFITSWKFSQMCRTAGLADKSPSSFADEYGYTAVIAVKVNGKNGYACFS